MNLKFIEVDTTAPKPKATIHISGKLGFNMEAAKFMDIGESTYFRIAVDDGKQDVEKIYLISALESTQGVVKVAKAGQYYYMNLGNVFKKLRMNYETYIISFDIDADRYEESDMFILTRRRKKEKLRGSSDNKANEEED